MKKQIFLTIMMTVSALYPMDPPLNGVDDERVNKELFEAIERGELQGVYRAIAHGAKINSAKYGMYERSPLEMALWGRKIEIAKELIRRGVDPRRHGCLHWSAKYSSIMLQYILAQGYATNVRNCSRTPLHDAALFGNLESVAALLQAGADINEKDAYGNTPLHCATRVRQVLAVRELLRRGAERNALDRDQKTPLHYAVETGKVDTVAELLVYGADTSLRDCDKQTPLQKATLTHNRHFIVRLFSAAHILAAQRTARMSQTGVQHDEDIRESIRYLDLCRSSFKEGMPAFHAECFCSWIQSRKTCQSCHLLPLAMNAQILDFYLLQAVEMGDHEMVKALLEHGADFNAQNDKRQPVLLIAASRGHLNVVEALLTYPGVYNIQGVTRGVKEAARGNHKAIVRMLVNHGAVVDENDPIVMKVLAELENKADVFLAGSHE